jgi:uncharacterized protein (TIGR00297 family)
VGEEGTRLLWGIAVSGGLAAVAWGLGLVTAGGATAGFLVGVAVYGGMGLAGFLCLATFFLVGSGLTRLGYGRKAERGVAEPRRGARGPREVLGKGAVAAGLALASLGGWPGVSVAFAGALASALSDTASTEVGQLSRGGAWLLVPVKPVPTGTPGAVSAWGVAAGALGSLGMGLLCFALGVVPGTGAVAAALGGFLANLLESVVRSATGARIGCPASSAGHPGTRLGDCGLNLVTTGAGAALSLLLWSLLR